jgi:putative hydrolase of the HAD superfamily
VSAAQKIEFILFDAFGTLFHFGDSANPARDFQRLLATDGVAAPIETARTAIAKEMAYFREQQRTVRTRDELERLRMECAEITIAALGGPEVCDLPPDRVAEILVETFPNVAFPDVEPAVRLARSRGVGVGVLSNFSYMLPIILDDLELMHLFDVVAFSADLGVEKPDPAIFLEAIRKAGVEPERAAHIGDNYEEDVQGARSANVKVVLLDRSGEAHRDDVPVAADLIEAVELLVGLPETVP